MALEGSVPESRLRQPKRLSKVKTVREATRRTFWFSSFRYPSGCRRSSDFVLSPTAKIMVKSHWN